MYCGSSLKPHKVLKAVSLFTGAGGLDIGMERAGFDVISTVEIEQVFCKTLEVNKKRCHPVRGFPGRFHLDGTDILCRDVSTVSATDLVPTSVEIDCVFGGPPCQPFSSAGKMGSTNDPRGTLFKDFVRLVDEIRPKIILFENVRGLVTARCDAGKPGGALNIILTEFHRIGYSCKVMLMNAADYGAYQRRVRCFIIGSDSGAAPLFPAATYTKSLLSASSKDSPKPWRTLGEFLKKFGDHDEKKWVRPTADLDAKLKNVPEGSGLKSAGVVESTRPGGHWGYRQGTFIADRNLPARTVTGSCSQDWIRLPDRSLRRLTFKEVSLLQGFPEKWDFAGSKAHMFKQVGNAVPAIFAEVLGRRIASYIQDEYRTGQKISGFELPETIMKHIRYTESEERRNGASRRKAEKAAIA